MDVLKMTKKQMLEKYIETQEGTVDSVGDQLKDKETARHTSGWMMIECQNMSSHLMGQKVLMPFGPECSNKSLPESASPHSINGMPSGMGAIIGWCEI